MPAGMEQVLALLVCVRFCDWTVCVRVCVCVCVCVCVREKEREREQERGREGGSVHWAEMGPCPS